MQRGKTAIGKFDRVAFCSPAGHLTSSYWAAGIRGCMAAVRSNGTEIRSEAQDLPHLNQLSGVLFVPLSRPLPAPLS
jgi:hypothetical protein